ncbi:MAG: metallophosphoesterase family protein [Calditrichia bacterium]
MATIEAAAHQQLSKLYHLDTTLRISIGRKKIVILSDLHLGNGGGADDFVHNEHIFRGMMQFYMENGYMFILAGDIEEFWQFSLKEIIKRYDNLVYSKFREMDSKKVCRIYGNHDIDWMLPDDPLRKYPKEITQPMEAVILKIKEGYPNILICHGHQGSEESDRFSKFSRFFVKMFRYVEPLAKRIGFYKNPSAPTSSITKDYERIFYRWGKENSTFIICGHSHRAIFASQNYSDILKQQIRTLQEQNKLLHADKHQLERNVTEIEALMARLNHEKERGRDINSLEESGEPLPLYFNTGCGLYKNGITSIEITQQDISLIKWQKNNNQIERIVYNQSSWADLIKNIQIDK